MKHLRFERLLSGAAMLLLCGLRGEGLSAAESPMEVIRTTTREALAVLEDPAYQGAERRQAQMKKMWEIILPSFDNRDIAQRALGVHW